jgi:hypothetical protein
LSEASTQSVAEALLSFPSHLPLAGLRAKKRWVLTHLAGRPNHTDSA